MWTKDLDHCIDAIPDGSSRVNAVIVKTSTQNILLINAYMPTSGSLTGDKYDEVLDEIHTLTHKYDDLTPIWTGDFNADTQRLKSPNDKCLEAFLNEEHMRKCPILDNLPTYHHFNNSILF